MRNINIRIVKEKVCMAFLAIGLGLAAVHEFGCSVGHAAIADTPEKPQKVIIVRG
ncbi:hypothetical protein [Aliikangiella coralliicola]|uniref:hypothetical protein n=1 Tax=Aliikangiella coralliicola TaxID=2592383 RepID=UPI00143E03AB|nr:hypothetical protein [Aliikangiella coralliicola]